MKENTLKSKNTYENKRMCPHVTLDINTGQLFQHIPFEFAALTVPEPVATLTVVAPDEEHEIFPDAPFEAEEVNLTYTLLEATVPLDGA